MHKTHSAMYALVFTADLIVCILFWGIFMVDKGLLANESELKALPSWYNHSSHTVGIVAIIIDALLWKPASLPISSSILLIVTYFGGYVLYVEYLIRVHNLYPYPILANFSESGRFGFFGVIIIGIALCFGVSILIVRSLNKIPRKKMTTKSHQRLEKKEVTAVQNKQRKPKKAD
ncbi:unnamed protein product [Heterobilharzia americana]|nr:unnamed protein product [Heterobilharzia americana]